MDGCALGAKSNREEQRGRGCGRLEVESTALVMVVRRRQGKVADWAAVVGGRHGGGAGVKRRATWWRRLGSWNLNMWCG
ncbi:hypothetical protein M0R45_002632 [Rubus argutus]|uniref:Uncharacterized protein n=1 Tax=Rubus argutus TaxID=59490 RepID=A0AAW1VR06_RUBAR